MKRLSQLSGRRSPGSSLRTAGYSQLSPKLAFVLAAKDGDETVLRRTILFGDSPPPFGAKPRLLDRNGKTHFVLELPDNRETLSVELPPAAGSASILYLVKSLPSGALVYDRLPVTPIS